MSDSDDLDLEGGDAQDAGSLQKKKGRGLRSILPTILKFTAIGLGALIFIVTVAVITYNIMNRGGKPQTVVTDPSSPYIGRRPEFAMYTMIGPVTTRTRDVINNTVTVDMILGYDINNQAATMELINRQFELRDFVRRYFSAKYAAELVPEREDELKKEILEQLNTRFLDTAKIRIVLFNRLDVMEVF